MISLVKNKRRIAFFLTLDPHRKKLFTKYFCYSLIKIKNYPELDKEEVLMQINKLESSKFHEVIEGKHYRKNSLSVFGENLDSSEVHSSFEYSYDPYSQLEKSREIDDLQYEKLNLYKYFSQYNNFLKAFTNIDTKFNQGEHEKVETFIKCLCKIFVGHNIHQRINNEISKKTNLYILKGDFFFSLGYFTVSQIGNPLLIRFYSKIAENFAKNIFYLQNFVKSINNSACNDIQYMNLLVKKYVGLVYYGCCGIKEIHQNFALNESCDLLKEFSFKYGLLLFLREELAFLKNKTYEYYSTFDELISLFLLYSENKLSEINKDSTFDMRQRVKQMSGDPHYLNKYKYLALNISSDLIGIIDSLKLSLNQSKLEDIEEMKKYLRGVCIDVENLTKI